MDLISRVARAWITAGNVLQFPVKKPPPKVPTMKIGGKTYRLSNIPGHMYVFDEGPIDPPKPGMGARVIQGDPRFNYLWVLIKPSDEVRMWRASEGDDKLGRRLYDFPASFRQRLEDAGALNIVTPSELKTVERAMALRQRKLVKRLKQQILESSGPVFERAQELARDLYRKKVRPEFKRQYDAYLRGAIPLGFKSIEGGFPKDRQAASYILGRVMDQYFTEDTIEAYWRSQGLDPSQLDIQDSSYLRTAIHYEEARSLLPKVR